MGSRDIGSGRRYSNMNKSIVQQRQDNIICAHLTRAPNTAVRKNNHIYDNSSENNRTIYLHNVKMPIFQALIDLITDDVVRRHLSSISVFIFSFSAAFMLIILFIFVVASLRLISSFQLFPSVVRC